MVNNILCHFVVIFIVNINRICLLWMLLWLWIVLNESWMNELSPGFTWVVCVMERAGVQMFCTLSVCNMWWHHVSIYIHFREYDYHTLIGISYAFASQFIYTYSRVVFASLWLPYLFNIIWFTKHSTIFLVLKINANVQIINMQ